MKPNFALDLSHEGIGLFHRAKGGWTLVGDVALDDPELSAKIGMLRKTVADLSPGGFTTKLIIPESQILFTTLTAPGPDDITREVQIRAGLEGLTPYEVGELVFDWQAEGDQVHVAVLARETLSEAEAFATEHRMNPVSYVARGKRGTFKGEAFFGRTGAASTLLGPAQQVERDKKAVPVMVGTATRFDTLPEPVTDVATAPIRLEDPLIEEAPAEEAPVDLAPFPAVLGDAPVEENALVSDPTPVFEPVAEEKPDLALDPFPKVEELPSRASADSEEERLEDLLASVPDPASADDDAEEGLLAPFPPTPAEGDEDQPLPPITPVIRDQPEETVTKPRAKRGKTSQKAKESAKPADKPDDTPTQAPVSEVRPDSPTVETVARKAEPEKASEVSKEATSVEVRGGTPELANDGPEAGAPGQTPEAASEPADAPPTFASRRVKVPEGPAKAVTEGPSPEAEQKPAAATSKGHPSLGAVDRGAVPKGAPGLAGPKRDAPAPRGKPAKPGEKDPTPHVPVTADRVPGDPAEKPARGEAVKERGAALARDVGKSGKALLSSARRGLGKGVAGAAGVAGQMGRAGKAAAAARAERKAAEKAEASSATAKPKASPSVSSSEGEETAKPSVLAAFVTRRRKVVGDSQASAKPARSAQKSDEEAKVDTAIAPPPKRDEAEAMTVFGARQTETVGGKPRYLGLALTLLLLLAMAAAAVWSMFSFSDEPRARFDLSEAELAAALEPEPEPLPATKPELAPEPEPPVEELVEAPEQGVAPELAPDAEPTPEELAELEMEEAPLLAEPPEPELPLVPEVLDREAAEARYAASGIWERAPEAAEAPLGDRISDIYIASIDPEIRGRDPVALPRLGTAQHQDLPEQPAAPAPPGTTFDFDDRGLVRATPEGALTPEGILVFSGRPEVTTGRRPGTVEPEAVDEGGPDIPRIRPTRRPEGLVENNERATLGGLSRDELAAIRPTRRPETVLAAAAAPDAGAVDAAVEAAIEGLTEEALASATSSAVASSPRPDKRPANFDSIVARSEDNSDGSVAVATPAAAPQPSIPTSASVAEQATIDGALNLRRINLIGVYGAANSRRALVRLPSGRFVKVSVGDRLDGGKVTSISANKLTYQKGGRTHTLEVPPLG